MRWTWLKEIYENKTTLFYRRGKDYEAIPIRQDCFLFNLDEIIDKHLQ